MAMHTTVHLNKADVIAIKNALELYLEDLMKEERNMDNADPEGTKLDILHVRALITKVTR